jgi:hypothetical protein
MYPQSTHTKHPPPPPIDFSGNMRRNRGWYSSRDFPVGTRFPQIRRNREAPRGPTTVQMPPPPTASRLPPDPCTAAGASVPRRHERRPSTSARARPVAPRSCSCSPSPSHAAKVGATRAVQRGRRRHARRPAHPSLPRPPRCSRGSSGGDRRGRAPAPPLRRGPPAEISRSLPRRSRSLPCTEREKEDDEGGRASVGAAADESSSPSPICGEGARPPLVRGEGTGEGEAPPLELPPPLQPWLLRPQQVEDAYGRGVPACAAPSAPRLLQARRCPRRHARELRRLHAPSPQRCQPSGPDPASARSSRAAAPDRAVAPAKEKMEGAWEPAGKRTGGGMVEGEG